MCVVSMNFLCVLVKVVFFLFCFLSLKHEVPGIWWIERQRARHPLILACEYVSFIIYSGAFTPFCILI